MSTNGNVVAIFVCPKAGDPMQSVEDAVALAGSGLAGDRYSIGYGSFNKGRKGKRQVTLINAIFFEGSSFTYAESRRNIVVEGVELNWLVGREFKIGAARLRGVKYCDPCTRPNILANKSESFKDEFFDRGGIIAEVIEGGIIKVNDDLIPPAKGY